MKLLTHGKKFVEMSVLVQSVVEKTQRNLLNLAAPLGTDRLVLDGSNAESVSFYMN